MSLDWMGKLGEGIQRTERRLTSRTLIPFDGKLAEASGALIVTVDWPHSGFVHQPAPESAQSFNEVVLVGGGTHAIISYLCSRL
jgi:hypothetical protein